MVTIKSLNLVSQVYTAPVRTNGSTVQFGQCIKCITTACKLVYKSLLLVMKSLGIDLCAADLSVDAKLTANASFWKRNHALLSYCTACVSLAPASVRLYTQSSSRYPNGDTSIVLFCFMQHYQWLLL